MPKETVEVLVTPISGGAFPLQLSACKCLAASGYKPDIALGGSGGTVVSYIMEAASWDEITLAQIMEDVNSSLFVQKPLYPVVGWLSNIIRGYVFKSSPAAEAFQEKLLKRSLPFSCEIWTGSQDTPGQKGIYACNMSKGNSMLSLQDEDLLETGLHPPFFAGGDLNLLAKYISSSYAIPCLIPAVEVEGRLLSDPGMTYGSPIHGMRRSIVRMAAHLDVTPHMTILTSLNLDDHCLSAVHSVPPKLLTTLVNEIHGSIIGNLIKDRLACNDVMWFQRLRAEGRMLIKPTPRVMERLKAYKTRSPGTVTEIYSTTQKLINLTDFRKSDLCEAVRVGFDTLQLRLTWFAKMRTDCKQSIFCRDCNKGPREFLDADLRWLLSMAEDVTYYNYW